MGNIYSSFPICLVFKKRARILAWYNFDNPKMNLPPSMNYIGNYFHLFRLLVETSLYWSEIKAFLLNSLRVWVKSFEALAEKDFTHPFLFNTTVFTNLCNLGKNSGIWRKKQLNLGKNSGIWDIVEFEWNLKFPLRWTPSNPLFC